MFQISKLGILPKIFLDLKDDYPLCASYTFGAARTTMDNKS